MSTLNACDVDDRLRRERSHVHACSVVVNEAVVDARLIRSIMLAGLQGR